MIKFYKKIISKVQISIRRIGFDGFFISCIFFLLLLIVNSNTIRVIRNGRSNYSIYQAEQQSLNDIDRKHEDLERKLRIVSSDEYQMLLAREVLGVTTPNETIFEVEKDPEFYKVEKVYIDVSTKENYSDWWISLIQ